MFCLTRLVWRRVVDLGDVVEVEGDGRAQPRKQIIDRRGVADRIGFEREAVPRCDPRREAQRRHHDVLNTAAAVINELEPGLPQRSQVVDPVVGRVGGERGLLEDRGREQALQRFDGGAARRGCSGRACRPVANRRR